MVTFLEVDMVDFIPSKLSGLKFSICNVVIGRVLVHWMPISL